MLCSFFFLKLVVIHFTLLQVCDLLVFTLTMVSIMPDRSATRLFREDDFESGRWSHWGNLSFNLIWAPYWTSEQMHHQQDVDVNPLVYRTLAHVPGTDVCTKEGEYKGAWWRFRRRWAEVALTALSSASSRSEWCCWPVWWQTKSLTLENGVVISSNWPGQFRCWPDSCHGFKI